MQQRAGCLQQRGPAPSGVLFSDSVEQAAQLSPFCQAASLAPAAAFSIDNCSDWGGFSAPSATFSGRFEERRWGGRVSVRFREAFGRNEGRSLIWRAESCRFWSFGSGEERYF